MHRAVGAAHDDVERRACIELADRHGPERGVDVPEQHIGDDRAEPVRAPETDREARVLEEVGIAHEDEIVVLISVEIAGRGEVVPGPESGRGEDGVVVRVEHRLRGGTRREAGEDGEGAKEGKRGATVRGHGDSRSGCWDRSAGPIRPGMCANESIERRRRATSGKGGGALRRTG